MDKSAPTFSGLITVFVKASLPVPNEKVFCPFTCTAKVEVVLFGLKRDGILYLSGEGDFDLVDPESSDPSEEVPDPLEDKLPVVWIEGVRLGVFFPLVELPFDIAVSSSPIL